MCQSVFKTGTKEEQIEFLNPLIDLAFSMIQAGVIEKNVVRHFTNKGLTVEVAENIKDLAACRLDKFTHYKSK